MSAIKGNDRIIYIRQNTATSFVWIPIACLTSNSFSETSSTFSVTTRLSGGWEQDVPDGQSYNIEFSGVNQDTGLSYEDLKVLKRSQIRIRWAIGKDLVFSDIGEGYINDLSVEDATNTDSLFSGSIRGYGRPTTIAQGIGVNTEEFLSDGTDDNLITP